MEDIAIKALGTCLAFAMIFMVYCVYQWVKKQSVNRIDKYRQKQEDEKNYKKDNTFVNEEDFYNKMYNGDNN